jgi:hypothetical protein
VIVIEKIFSTKKLPKNRDRGKPHDFPPPTPPGIRVRTTAVRSSYLFG